MSRARVALDGLSVGDAFGERFFGPASFVEVLIRHRELPPSPWWYTDDTEMALGIVEVLDAHGRIDQDVLATTFARRYAAEPRRGYGGTAHRILREIGAGRPWRDASNEVFDGMGSMGNGGAMRVAPVGAYFADEYPIIGEEACRSAEVTHASVEGQAGAIAVAVATAWTWRRGQYGAAADQAEVTELFARVLEHTPDSLTRAGVARAADLPLGFDVRTAVAALGSGLRMTAQDTVPLCIWLAARHLDDYVEAMWQTVGAGGDIDTNCAIVGGIVVMAMGAAGIPPAWLAAREELKW